MTTIGCKYEILAEFAIDNHNLYKDKPEKLNLVTGLLAEGLFRMPAIHSGYISEEANSTGQKCKEHYWGRKGSADMIMIQINKGKSFKRIVALIKSRARVHYTTSQENNYLKSYGNLFWRDAYKKAGIKLILYQDQRQKYHYSVHGVIFKTKDEVTKKYNIDGFTSDYRCRSKSKKWLDWNFVEIARVQ